MTERAIADRLEALSAWHDKSEASGVVPLLSVPATSFPLDPAAQNAIVTENANARLVGLRSSLSMVALIIVLALYFARMLPDAAIDAEDPDAEDPDAIEPADRSNEPPTVV